MRRHDRSTANSRSRRPNGGDGAVHRVWRAPETSPRSSSGSAGRPTTRGWSPRSIPIPTRPQRPAAQGGRADRRPRPGPGPAQPRRRLPLRRVAGAAGVVIPERRSAEVTAVTCKASAGAVEHLSIARVRNLADWLGEAKKAGFWIWGADAAPSRALGRRPQRLDRARPRRGGERDPSPGRLRLRRPRRPAAAGQIDSLNVSAAAAALLFEAVRQRS